MSKKKQPKQQRDNKAKHSKLELLIGGWLGGTNDDFDKVHEAIRDSFIQKSPSALLPEAAKEHIKQLVMLRRAVDNSQNTDERKRLMKQAVENAIAEEIEISRGYKILQDAPPKKPALPAAAAAPVKKTPALQPTPIPDNVGAVKLNAGVNRLVAEGGARMGLPPQNELENELAAMEPPPTPAQAAVQATASPIIPGPSTPVLPEAPPPPEPVRVPVAEEIPVAAPAQTAVPEAQAAASPSPKPALPPKPVVAPTPAQAAVQAPASPLIPGSSTPVLPDAPPPPDPVRAPEAPNAPPPSPSPKGFQLSKENIKTIEAGINRMPEVSRPFHLEILNSLKDTEDHARAQVKGGATLLHLAVKAGAEDVAQKLVNAGADVNVQDEILRSPLEYATDNQNQKIIAILNNANAPRSSSPPPMLDLAPTSSSSAFAPTSSSAAALASSSSADVKRERSERPDSLTQAELQKLKLPLGNGAKLHDNAEVRGEQIISFGTQAEAQAFAKALFGGGAQKPPMEVDANSEARRFGVVVEQDTINKMQFVARGEKGWSAEAAFGLSRAIPAQPQEPAARENKAPAPKAPAAAAQAGIPLPKKSMTTQKIQSYHKAILDLAGQSEQADKLKGLISFVGVNNQGSRVHEEAVGAALKGGALANANLLIEKGAKIQLDDLAQLCSPYKMNALSPDAQGKVCDAISSLLMQGVDKDVKSLGVVKPEVKFERGKFQFKNGSKTQTADHETIKALIEQAGRKGNKVNNKAAPAQPRQGFVLSDNGGGGLRISNVKNGGKSVWDALIKKAQELKIAPEVIEKLAKAVEVYGDGSVCINAAAGSTKDKPQLGVYRQQNGLPAINFQADGIDKKQAQELASAFAELVGILAKEAKLGALRLDKHKIEPPIDQRPAQAPAAQGAAPAQQAPQPQRPPVQQQQYALFATTTPGVFVQALVITPAEYRQNLNDQMDKFLSTEKDRFFAMELAKNPNIKNFDEIPEGKRKQFEVYEKGQVARKENLLQQNFLQEEMATAAPDRAGFLQQKLIELQQIQFERDKEYVASIERAQKGGLPYDAPATQKMNDLQYKQNPLIFEGHIETVTGAVKRSELNQEMIGELQAMAGKNAQVQAKAGAVNARVVLDTPKEAQEFLEKMAAVHDVKGRDQTGKKFYPNSDKPPKFVVYVTPGEVQKVKESMQAGNNFAKGIGKAQEVAKVVAVAKADAPVVAKAAEVVVAREAEIAAPILAPTSSSSSAAYPTSSSSAAYPPPSSSAAYPTSSSSAAYPTQPIPQEQPQGFVAKAVSRIANILRPEEVLPLATSSSALSRAPTSLPISPQAMAVRRALNPPGSPPPPNSNPIVPSAGPGKVEGQAKEGRH